jgi:cobyrinic acid a,c-diamide synthase
MSLFRKCLWINWKKYIKYNFWRKKLAMKKILISGAMSGSGKTTVSSILMSAFENVAPFKVGPDYIDPGYHEFFTGNKSHNLDAFMFDEKTLKHIFDTGSEGKSMAITEGVMGLYDGVGHEKDNFSTAHLSRILNIPIILVVNAKGISTSVAAEILGFKLFDENVRIKGVILNNVSSEKLYLNLKEAIERFTGIECVGYLPRNEKLSVESRHLGLKQAFELKGPKELEEKKQLFKEIAEKCLDLERIYEIAEEFEPEGKMGSFELIKDLKNKYKGKRVGIAKDGAFSFYYESNLELMKFSGLELVEFSPIEDEKIPENLDMIYLGGGYPELYWKELSENISMKESIRQAYENGVKIYGECGGFIYLTNKLNLLDGNSGIFCGLIDVEISMRNRLNIGRFGYINIETGNGIHTKGHEFHYSEISVDNEKGKFYKIEKNDGRNWNCGYRKKSLLAGYPHISFYSNIEFFKYLIEEL